MISVGIFGASGYMGGEALRLLLEHPEVNIAWATSRTPVSASLAHKNLSASLDPKLKDKYKKIDFIQADSVSHADCVFFALPTGHVAEPAKELRAKGSKIIDLGAEFRLRDQDLWERVYGKKHHDFSLVEKSVYGIPELHREKIKNSSVVANPGCFSSAAILGLLPLFSPQSIVLKATNFDSIMVSGLSGTAGVGAELDKAIHHPEITNNVVAYNGVDHRHTYEMEQELSQFSGEKVTVHFTPAYVPISRGIVALCSIKYEKDSIKTLLSNKRDLSREMLIEMYKGFYKDEAFVHVVDTPFESAVSWQTAPYPWVAATSCTNFCHIGVDVDPVRDRILVVSVLDSMGKGGAHVGIQNMNLMFGFDEVLGINRRGFHPY
jgi:N-acetyl-gamma-glutamyl-phosphate reductase